VMGARSFTDPSGNAGPALRYWRASCIAAAASAAVGILAMHMTPAGSLYGYGAVLVAFFAVAVWLKAIDMKL